jgi:GNAT superfamily N-acetyltransferase
VIAIRPMAPSDRSAVVALLVGAFVDDRGMQALLAGRMQGLGPWFDATLGLLAPPSGLCLVAYDGPAPCGVLLSSAPTGPGAGRQLVWSVRVWLSAGMEAVLRTASHDRHRRGGHAGSRTVVEFVAVDPARRGQGVGARLFSALHERGGQHWLETTRPENLPIFARLGYRETSRRIEHGVTYIAMERPATP